jgi:hypothetical protein
MKKLVLFYFSLAIPRKKENLESEKDKYRALFYFGFFAWPL